MVSIYVAVIFVVILGILGVRYIAKVVKGTVNRDYKYHINLHKEGYRRAEFPMVKVKIRNKYKFFIVDSGANTNMIARSSYKEIVGDGAIKSSSSVEVSGIGTSEGASASSPVVLETINVGEDGFEEEFCILSDWDHTKDMVEKLSGIAVVGVLGAPFCKTAKWVIDFDKLVIWVKNSN